MQRQSRLTDERLAALYLGEGFGGDKTMRAKVIRELIDEIRVLRRQLSDASDANGQAARASVPSRSNPS